VLVIQSDQVGSAVVTSGGVKSNQQWHAAQRCFAVRGNWFEAVTV